MSAEQGFQLKTHIPALKVSGGAVQCPPRGTSPIGYHGRREKKGHLGRMEYLAEELQLVSPDDSSTEEKKNEKGRKGKNNYFSASNLSSK